MTGAAGFVGSHLVDALLASGQSVRGVDCFTDYYDPATKRQNLVAALAHPDFELRTDDLRDAALEPLLDGVEFVHHLAGQAGVRLSWSDGFGAYESCNVSATQRLLEATLASDVRRLVYASSSSVYGNATFHPVVETDQTSPHSPYGVTKLAAEHLCTAYAHNHGLPTIALRYFSVYGPRQRPDMAHHRLIEAALTGEPFPLYGDGSQIRDFTFVRDVVEAHLLAVRDETDVDPGTVINVCAGGSTVVRDLIDAVGESVGRPVEVDKLDAQPGDVHRTGGSNELARDLLGWEPTTSLDEGIRAQVEWHRARRRS